MPYIQDAPRKAVSIHTLQAMHNAGEKIAMLACYDASFASMLEICEVDVMLIGDSLGNVIQGHSSTLPVTIDHMVYHTEAVVRGSKRALIVSDMPFAAYATRAQAFES